MRADCCFPSVVSVGVAGAAGLSFLALSAAFLMPSVEEGFDSEVFPFLCLLSDEYVEQNRFNSSDFDSPTEDRN